jgi:hypothetical protein
MQMCSLKYLRTYENLWRVTWKGYDTYEYTSSSEQTCLFLVLKFHGSGLKFVFGVMDKTQ